MSAGMWLLIRSLAAGIALVLVVGSWLLDNGHRLRVIARWRPVRRSAAAREAALSAGSSFERQELCSEVGWVGSSDDRQSHATGPRPDFAVPLDAKAESAGSDEPAKRGVGTQYDSLTNLVPFSRSQSGYAFNFSQKTKNGFSRNPPTSRVR